MLESQLESLAISGETLTNLCWERCQRSQNKMRVPNTMNICEVGIDTLDAFRLTRFQCDVAVFGLGSSKKEMVLWLSRAKFNACHLHSIQTQTLYFFAELVWTHIKENYFSFHLGHKNLQEKRYFYEIQTIKSIKNQTQKREVNQEDKTQISYIWCHLYKQSCTKGDVETSLVIFFEIVSRTYFSKRNRSMDGRWC